GSPATEWVMLRKGGPFVVYTAKAPAVRPGRDGPGDSRGDRGSAARQRSSTAGGMSWRSHAAGPVARQCVRRQARQTGWVGGMSGVMGSPSQRRVQVRSGDRRGRGRRGRFRSGRNGQRAVGWSGEVVGRGRAPDTVEDGLATAALPLREAAFGER